MAEQTPGPTPRAEVQRNGPAAQPTAVQQKAVPATVIPKGARYTIFCESFTGDDHVQRATEMKNILIANAKVKGWYVIHKDGQSTIYHGYYGEFNLSNATDAATRKEAERAQNDKKMVEALPNPIDQTQRLFPRSLFVSLDSPDPDAPPEWNLVNSGGYYSVEVAVYTGFDRKQFAIESVRDARKMNIPAYYYHGPSYSSVCIGVWPASAVVERSVDQVNSIPQGSDIFVDVQGGEIPQAMREGLLRQGRNVQVVVPKVKVVDQTLIDTMRAYPEHAVDYQVEMYDATNPVTKKVEKRPKPSLLVRVPAGEGPAQAEVDDRTPPTLVQPNQSPNNLGARLRGLNQ